MRGRPLSASLLECRNAMGENARARRRAGLGAVALSRLPPRRSRATSARRGRSTGSAWPRASPRGCGSRRPPAGRSAATAGAASARRSRRARSGARRSRRRRCSPTARRWSRCRPCGRRSSSRRRAGRATAARLWQAGALKGADAHYEFGNDPGFVGESPVTADPTDARTAWFCQGNLYVTHDAGRSWAVATPRFKRPWHCAALAIAPGKQHTLILLVQSKAKNSKRVPGKLLRSVDGGATWKRARRRRAIRSSTTTATRSPSDPAQPVDGADDRRERRHARVRSTAPSTPVSLEARAPGGHAARRRRRRVRVRERRARARARAHRRPPARRCSSRWTAARTGASRRRWSSGRSRRRSTPRRSRRAARRSCSARTSAASGASAPEAAPLGRAPETRLAWRVSASEQSAGLRRYADVLRAPGVGRIVGGRADRTAPDRAWRRSRRCCSCAGRAARTPSPGWSSPRPRSPARSAGRCGAGSSIAAGRRACCCRWPSRTRRRSLALALSATQGAPALVARGASPRSPARRCRRSAPCMRALWPSLLEGQGLRDTAYALEAWLQELFFICGPLIVAAIAVGRAGLGGDRGGRGASPAIGTVWFALAPGGARGRRLVAGSRLARGRARLDGRAHGDDLVRSRSAPRSAWSRCTMPAFGEAHGSRAQGGLRARVLRLRLADRRPLDRHASAGAAAGDALRALARRARGGARAAARRAVAARHVRAHAARRHAHRAGVRGLLRAGRRAGAARARRPRRSPGSTTAIVAGSRSARRPGARGRAPRR